MILPRNKWSLTIEGILPLREWQMTSHLLLAYFIVILYLLTCLTWAKSSYKEGQAVTVVTITTQMSQYQVRHTDFDERLITLDKKKNFCSARARFKTNSLTDKVEKICRCQKDFIHLLQACVSFSSYVSLSLSSSNSPYIVKHFLQSSTRSEYKADNACSSILRLHFAFSTSYVQACYISVYNPVQTGQPQAWKSRAHPYSQKYISLSSASTFSTISRSSQVSLNISIFMSRSHVVVSRRIWCRVLEVCRYVMLQIPPTIAVSREIASHCMELDSLSTAYSSS